MQKAGGAVQGYADRVAGVALKVAGSLAAIFSVAKLTGAVNDTINAIDDLAKSADRIGVSTEELQTFRLAADLAGISVESLTTAFRFSQRALSEAASGTKEYADTFRMLGLSVSALQQMSPAEQFRAITNALQAVGNQADRTRLAMEVFGRGGSAMLTFNTASLEDAANTIGRVGGAISRLDAAKVEEANDAMTRMKAAASMLWSEIVIMLAPAIEAAADMFIEMLPAIRPIFDSLKNAIVSVAGAVQRFLSSAEGIRFVQQLTRTLTAGMSILVGVIEAAVSVFNRLNVKKIAEVARVLLLIISPLATIIGFAQDAFGAGKTLSESLSGIDAGPLDKVAAAAGGAADALGHTDRAARRLSDGSIAPVAYRITINGQEQVYEAGRALRAVSQENFEGLGSGLRNVGTQARQAAEGIDEIGPGGLEDATQAAKEAEAALKAAAKAADEWWEAHDRGSDKMKEVQRAAERWAKEMESPGEKLTRQLQELQGLFDQRLISPDVFERGNAKVRADYEAAQEAANEIENTFDRIEGTPAIMKGSAEDFASIAAANRALMEARQKRGEEIRPDVGNVEPLKIPVPDTAPATAAIRGLQDEAAGINLGTVPFGQQTEQEAAKIEAAISRIQEMQMGGMSLEGMQQADMTINRLRSQLDRLRSVEVTPVEIAFEPPQIPPVEAEVETPDLTGPVTDWADQASAGLEQTAAALEGRKLEPYVEDIEPPKPRQLEPYVEDIEPPTPEPPKDDLASRIKEVQDAGKKMQELTQAQQALLRVQEQQAKTLEQIEKNTKEKTKVTEATI